MSIPTYEKPIQHVGLADWHAKQWQNQQTNSTYRNNAFNLRYDSYQLRNETKIRTDWDTYFNNVRLNDRITELDHWRDTFKSCLERVESEIKNLKDEKFSTERELDGLGIPLSIVGECISMRDCRQGGELTYDEGDTELKTELCVIENVKRLFIERLQATWEKLNKLEEIRFQLNLELNDKIEAIEIDKDQLSLNKNCSNISYKTDPLRTVKNSITYEEWLEHTHHIKNLADNELADTHKLREALFVVRERSRNDLKAQRDRVDFILRKRIYETQKARNELEWQQLRMREEMERLLKEIKNLEIALMEKTDALKLCETRLENRSNRPGYELARDEVEQGLKDEVGELRQTRSVLIDKINCAKSTYNALEQRQIIIENDLECKNHSLMTDIRCLDMRIRLRSGEFAGPSTDTDRNIQLTKMEHEIPPV